VGLKCKSFAYVLHNYALVEGSRPIRIAVSEGFLGWFLGEV
jgi:hypothetical protein